MKRSLGVTIFGIVMLMQSFLLLFLSYFSFDVFHFGIGKSRNSLSAAHFSFITLCALIYLLSAINILRLKNWARRCAVYLSGLILVLCAGLAVFISLLIYINLSNSLNIDWEDLSLLIGFLYPIIFSAAPALLFLVFFIYPTVKRQFG